MAEFVKVAARSDCLIGVYVQQSSSSMTGQGYVLKERGRIKSIHLFPNNYSLEFITPRGAASNDRECVAYYRLSQSCHVLT